MCKRHGRSQDIVGEHRNIVCRGEKGEYEGQADQGAGSGDMVLGGGVGSSRAGSRQSRWGCHRLRRPGWREPPGPGAAKSRQTGQPGANLDVLASARYSHASPSTARPARAPAALGVGMQAPRGLSSRPMRVRAGILVSCNVTTDGNNDSWRSASTLSTGTITLGPPPDIPHHTRIFDARDADRLARPVATAGARARGGAHHR